MGYHSCQSRGISDRGTAARRGRGIMREPATPRDDDRSRARARRRRAPRADVPPPPPPAHAPGRGAAAGETSGTARSDPEGGDGSVRGGDPCGRRHHVPRGVATPRRPSTSLVSGRRRGAADDATADEAPREDRGGRCSPRNCAINDQSARVLVSFLNKNSRLVTLNLTGNSGITAHGWQAFLDLVGGARSMGDVRASNYTLCSLGNANQTFVDMLGADDANFLDALLRLNGNSDKRLVLKRKLIWSHIRGRTNIGDCPSAQDPLVTSLMPQVLACFSDFPNEADALFLYRHQPQPSDLELAVMQLEAMFRTLRIRPDLFQVGSVAPELQRS